MVGYTQENDQLKPEPGQAKADQIGHGAFFETLTQYLAESAIQHVRFTPKGLFVREDQLDEILLAYQTWLSQVTGRRSDMTLEKCMRRLFGEELPQLKYLIDGKTCLPGFLLPTPSVLPRRSPIAFAEGVLLETRDYLHPRDPILEQAKNYQAVLNSQSGLQLTVRQPRGDYYLSGAVLSQFAEVVRGSKELSLEFPGAKAAVRNCIEPLCHILPEARAVRPGQSLLVPLHLAQSKAELYLRYRNLIVTLDHDRRILGFWSVGGAGLAEFVKVEIQSGLCGTGRRTIPGFNVSLGDPAVLGTLEVKHSTVTILLRPFLAFLAQVGSGANMPRSLPLRYTVLDCLRCFLGLLLHSKLLPAPAVARSRGAAVMHRHSGGWDFSIVRHQLISVRQSRKGSNRKGSGRPSNSATAIPPATSQQQPSRSSGVRSRPRGQNKAAARPDSAGFSAKSRKGRNG